MAEDRRRVDELRTQLGQIDRDILRSIERRARLAQELSGLRTGTARFAPLADGAYMTELERAVEEPLTAAAVRPIFNAIDGACRLFDVAPRVGFVGAEGGFGWMAARSYFGAGADLHRADTSGHAIEEVGRSRVDFAVVPYESLQDGPIFPTIQAVAAADLKLVGEREMTQVLVLVNATGEMPSEVEKVYVSAQDHVASVQYLESNHPRALVLDVRSPVMAWELASENQGSAAIVPRGSVGANDLRVARENIGDEGEVRMRYGVISRLPAPRSGSDATALLFSVSDRPGALHDILQHFKERDCNLRRIQSRPVPGEGWEYVFYVEVQNHITDRPLVAALEGVKRVTKMLKIIGSFPLEASEPAPPESTLDRR
jgi:chorismate mutase/prephenate dehydratase